MATTMASSLPYDPRRDSSEGYDTDPERLVLVINTEHRSLCGCGCQEPTAPKREFRMGHDQRLRGMLMRAHLQGVPVEHLPSGAVQPAMTVAEFHGWEESLRSAERKRDAAVAAAVERASKSEKPHKLGKSDAKGLALVVIYDLKSGGQEVEWVDRQGKKGRKKLERPDRCTSND